MKLEPGSTVLVLTGAGIPLASGIRSFRGEGGWWTSIQRRHGVWRVSSSLLTEVSFYRDRAAGGWGWSPISRAASTALRKKARPLPSLGNSLPEREARSRCRVHSGC